ncbi:hypothetical protein [Agromyces sp. LHK192]|uniref:hypothetical protein n=1 Tax=Agromyces sp. LHK192 TaxID=2498704 RepID=UPI000FD8B22A|nr:hypothetical protein [Agromyces sp. LHK192]
MARTVQEVQADQAGSARKPSADASERSAAPTDALAIALADRRLRPPPGAVAALQRSAGNAAVTRLLGAPSPRPRLRPTTADRPPTASTGRPPSAPATVPVAASTAPPAAEVATEASAGAEASVVEASVGAGAHAPTAPVGTAAMATGAAAAPAVAPNTTGGVVQRDDEEDSGFIASIRRRLSGIGDGIRSGWSSLRDGASGIVEGLRERGAGALDAIRAAGTRVGEFVRTTIAALPDSAKAAFLAIRNAVTAPVTAIVAGAGRLRDAVLRLDADGLAAAWGAVTGLASGALGAAEAMAGAVGRALSGLWDGAVAGFRGVLDAARTGANAAVDGLVGLASSATSRLGALWSRVEGFGADLVSADSWGGRIVRRVLGTLLSGAQRAWSTAQSGWQRTKDFAGGVASSVVSGARRAWDAASGAASAAWDAAGRTWRTAKDGIGAAADAVTGGVRSFVHRVRSFSVTSIVAKLRKYAEAVTGLRTVVGDPMSTIEPYAAGIAGKLDAGMPAAASDAVAPHVSAAAGGGGAVAPVAAPVQRQATAAPTEVERTTSSGGEVWAGLGAAFSEKWAKLDVKKMALDALKSIVWPWPKIGEELTGIGTDLSKAAGNLFMPRNLFDHPAQFFHDLWSDVMKLLDFPLILWRRLNNIALLLLGPITIVLTVIGFIGGSLAGTVLGGIAGALAGVGIGAAPGAGVGFAGGGVGGAGLGFGVAMGLGQAFLVSFAAGEVTALVKVLVDLFTTRQTRQEKADDYNTAADSGLALGITGILVGLGWIGGRIASACASVLRGFLPASVLAVIDEFAAGVRAARKGGLPTEDKPPVDDKPPVPDEKPPIVDPVAPDMRVPGPQTLTAAELAELQGIANKHQTRLQVTGSRGRGMGRGVESDAPAGKGPGTSSDIDVVIDGQRDIDTRGALSNDVSGACNGKANVASSIGEASGPHIDILPQPQGLSPGERPTIPPSERPTVPPGPPSDRPTLPPGGSRD